MLDFRIYKFNFRSYGVYFNNESASGRVVFNIFEDGLGWLESLKNSLEDPNNKGLCGEYVCVNKRGEDVEIELAGWNYDEEAPLVTMKKESLLKNIDVWMDLVQKGTPEIAIIYNKYGNIEIIDRRSNLELCLIDIDMRPVIHKNYNFVLLNRNFYVGADMRVLDNDLYLSMLSQVFTPTQEWTRMVEQALYDPYNKSIIYQDNKMVIEGQCVTIQCTHYYKPEQYIITISKADLLNLIEQWYELTARGVNFIIIKKYASQKIVMEEYKEPSKLFK